MSSMWGNNIKISIFGESHGQAIGVTIDNLPAGVVLDMEFINQYLKRRSPNGLPWATKRNEPDIPRILSGVFNGKTTGTPLCAIIENKDTRSEDYKKISNVPRPGHADLTAHARYGGFQDPRGGGHFSGRLTAPLVLAGAICAQILRDKKIYLYSHISSISDIKDKKFDTITRNFKNLRELPFKPFPVIDDNLGEKMKAKIIDIKNETDSLGGTIECMAVGFPAGVGSPMFDGIETKISSLMFSIPAVKGVEFGEGFGVAKLKGSQNNDNPYIDTEKGGIFYESNNAGGIEGGITNGMPITCNVAFKPTPSIAKEQSSIDLDTMKNTKISVTGRHDPCIVPRACVVVESAMAISLLDSYLQFFSQGGNKV